MMNDGSRTDHRPGTNVTNVWQNHGLSPHPNIAANRKWIECGEILGALSQDRVEEKCVGGFEIHRMIQIQYAGRPGKGAVPANFCSPIYCVHVETTAVGVEADFDVIKSFENFPQREGKILAPLQFADHVANPVP